MDPLLKVGAGLVTGAGSGMGQSISVLLAKEGCKKLLLADLVEAGLQKTKELIEKDYPETVLVLHKVDVSTEAGVMGMVKASVESFGRLDFAINCAGIARGSIKTTDMTVEIFQKLCSVNEKGIFFCLKHQITQMEKQEPLPIPTITDERAVRGAIVNIASLSATAIGPELGAYVSSKHGVLGLSKVYARESAPTKIRINCISPGYVNTPMMGSAGLSEKFLEMSAAQSPMNRMTLASEVAEGAVFLVSSRASGITGVNLAVDAGANLFHMV